MMYIKTRHHKMWIKKCDNFILKEYVKWFVNKKRNKVILQQNMIFWSSYWGTHFFGLHIKWLIFLVFILSDSFFWSSYWVTHFSCGGPSWLWWYGSCIYNYICNQCLSPLTLWVRIPVMRGELDTALCDKSFQWLVAGWWFSLGTLVSTTNKTDCHNITEILLKGVFNTITLTPF